MALGDEEIHEVAVSYGTIIGTGVLAVIVCTSRLLTRKFILDAFGLDDYACLVALIFTTMFNAVGINVVANGAGRHIEHVAQAELERWFLLYYACTCSYLFISLCVKSSLLLFLARLFPLPYMRRSTMALMIFMVLFTISGSLVSAFQCDPPRYVYDLRYVMSPDRAEHCFKPTVAYGVFLYQAVLLFSTDIIMLLLPVPALWNLNMSKGRGVVLFMVFGSAIVACIAPALRFQSINFYKSGNSDMTYFAASSLYWMSIEYNLGMVAGSLGCLKPLFVKLGIARAIYSGSDDKPSFTPSYELGSGGGWHHKLSRGRPHDRVQGDSVLRTVATMGDDDDGGRKRESSGSRERIIKTQEVTVSYTEGELYDNPYAPRFHEQGGGGSSNILQNPHLSRTP